MQKLVKSERYKQSCEYVYALEILHTLKSVICVAMKYQQKPLSWKLYSAYPFSFERSNNFKNELAA